MAISLVKKIAKVLINNTEVPLNLPNIQASKSVSVSGTKEILPDSGFDAMAKVIATGGTGGYNVAAGAITGSKTYNKTVSGLSFSPKFVFLEGIVTETDNTWYLKYSESGLGASRAFSYGVAGNPNVGLREFSDSDNDQMITMSSNGFTFSGYRTNVGDTLYLPSTVLWLATDFDAYEIWD